MRSDVQFFQMAVFECWAGGLAPPVAKEVVEVRFFGARTNLLKAMRACTEVRFTTRGSQLYFDDLVVENARPMPPTAVPSELPRA